MTRTSRSRESLTPAIANTQLEGAYESRCRIAVRTGSGARLADYLQLARSRWGLLVLVTVGAGWLLAAGGRTGLAPPGTRLGSGIISEERVISQ